MLVNSYNTESARSLAASVVTGAGSTARPAGAQVVDAGGGWQRNTWRDDLRRITDRGTVAALAVRTLPHEPRLHDRDWARLMHKLTGRIGLTHRPWVAVRTSATTVALITDSSRGPLHTDATRAFVRSVSRPDPLSDDPDQAVDPGTAAFVARPDGADAVAYDLDGPRPWGVAESSFAASPAAAPNPGGTTAPQPAAAASPQHQGSRPHQR